MGLIKNKELDNTGVSGNYWRIVQNNSNYDRPDNVVTLQLYKSQSGREEGKSPLAESVKFNFTTADNQLSEFDPQSVNTNLVENIEDLEKHVRYLHIKNIAVIAKGKEEKDRTTNEKNAFFFVDAEDSL